MKETKVVIGANYGDEGKGLVSYCLAKEAVNKGNKVLTVLFNGGAQRAHTADGRIFHGLGAGTSVGSDTYYDHYFMVDPIAIWLEKAKPYINPYCRVVLPCDVVNNHDLELSRRHNSQDHGTCGMGIFEACKRSNVEGMRITAAELMNTGRGELYDRLISIEKKYGFPRDLVYNNDNFLRAVDYFKKNCIIAFLYSDLVNEYDTIIYEGGQGLLLDQCNKDDFPHLTPSSTGLHNIGSDLYELRYGKPELYYVSRSYLTRHGRGPLTRECKREDINPDIVDKTNKPNPWQGEIRYGFLDYPALVNRVIKSTQDFYDAFGIRVRTNLVFTHLNYTDGKLKTGRSCFEKIQKSPFFEHIYASDKKDDMGVLL